MITQECLKALLDYDPLTGVFVWRRRLGMTGRGRCAWNTRYAGKPAGRVRSDGYVVIVIGKKAHKAHRLAWIYVHGDIPDSSIIDHTNGLPGDNRIENIRLATSLQNNANSKLCKANTSGFKGVCPHVTKTKGVRWKVGVRYLGRYHYCGLFDDKEEAHRAYFAKAQSLFGEFARAA